MLYSTDSLFSLPATGPSDIAFLYARRCSRLVPSYPHPLYLWLSTQSNYTRFNAILVIMQSFITCALFHNPLFNCLLHYYPTSLRDHSPRHILSPQATVAFVLNYYLIIFHFYVIFFYSSLTSHRWRSDASFYSILFFASALPASLALATLLSHPPLLRLFRFTCTYHFHLHPEHSSLLQYHSYIQASPKCLVQSHNHFTENALVLAN